MALFNEAYCAHCGKKLNPLNRVKLGDGNYLCKTCAGKVPYELSDKLRSYTYKEYQQALKYKEDAQALAKWFNPTHSYGDVKLDANNGIVCVGSGGLNYLRLENLEKFELEFRAETFNDNVFRPRVKGDVCLHYQVARPYFERSTLIKMGAKARAKKEYGIFKDKVIFINPDGMDEFMDVFNQTWKRCLEQRYAEMQQTFAQREAAQMAAY